jgi:signal transduction histidine kinase
MNVTHDTVLDGLFHTFESDDWSVVRDAVDQGGAILKRGGLPPALHAHVGEKLSVLAKHDKWEVRKALAHAVLFLRHKSFNRIISILKKDENSWVKNAAKRTVSRRSELSTADSLKDQHGDLMLKWLAELEVKHGSMARNAARRVAEKLNSQFITELNHELIKVISPLDASLDRIEDELNQPRMSRQNLQRHSERSKTRLKFLASIIDSLRSLTQDVNMEFQEESPLSVVNEAIHLVRDRKDANHMLEAEINIPPEITIEANRHLLLQAFSNIIQNSLEAYAGMDNSPKVIVSGTWENGRLKLTIADQGSGMSDEAVNDAFQLFATSKPQGTGFGLAVAKKIIESDHGGAVHLESVKGQGTTVTVFLQQTQEGLEW